MTCRLLLLVGALLVPAPQLSDQTTRLFLDSQPGDYIGGGIEQTYTEADGAFAASRNFSNGVSIGTLLEPALGKTYSRDVKVFGGHP